MTTPPITLSPNHRLHFIGIGGSGMAPLAEIASNYGFLVTGSDTAQSTVKKLENLGISVYIGQSLDLLKSFVEQGLTPAIVYSSAIKSDNYEFLEAQKLGLRLLHRSDLLNFFLSQKKHAITIAGTNGKSTISAMSSYLLYHLGKDPLAVVGAKMKDFSSLALSGKGEYSIAEADESDGSFLKYRPHVGLLTSIDLDHMDFFKDSDHIFQTFHQYLQNIQEEGTAIIGWDNYDCRRMSLLYLKRQITYGFYDDASMQGYNYKSKKGTISFSFEVFKKSFTCKLKLIGRHNAQNALASLAVVAALGLNLKDACEIISDFSGIDRRLDLIYSSSNLKIYDDYAHNPTKIQTVISAVRETWPEHQIIAIFQPHRHSRIKTLYNNFVGSFSNADVVIILPTYSSGEHDENPVPPEKIVESIATISGTRAIFTPTFDEAQNTIIEIVKKKSIVLTLGAGDVWKLAFQLKERLG